LTNIVKIKNSLCKEDKILVEVFKYIRMHKDLKYCSFHVPNEGKRTVQSTVNLLRKGMLKGVSDIFIMRPNGRYCGLIIELKTMIGKPSEEQQFFVDRMNENGYYAKVCYGLNDTIDTIDNYLRDNI
jgi:hypothetical protein